MPSRKSEPRPSNASTSRFVAINNDDDSAMTIDAPPSESAEAGEAVPPAGAQAQQGASEKKEKDKDGSGVAIEVCSAAILRLRCRVPSRV
jgi:hypothetical protein